MLIAGLAFLFGMSATSAQELQLSKILPVDIFTCKYNDAMSSDDLNDAIEGWTGYMDDNDIDNYAAWVLTKYYYTPAQDFDMIWLGAWTDANAMGSGTDQWLSEGGEYAARFNEVLTCNNHVNAASVNYKLPADGTPQDGVLTFANCKVEANAAYAAVNEATIAWAAALTDAGSEAAIYHWFPVFGGTPPESDMDFLAVTSYPSYTALGADYERRTNGGMFATYNELYDGKMDCDVARVYNARNIRATKLR